MQPNAMYLEFDLGADADAYRQLSDLLVSLGAAPKPQIILQKTAAEMPRHLIVIPIKVKNELADYGLAAFRLLEELNVEPCSIELKRVLGHVNSGGTVVTGSRTEPSAWAAVATGYRPTIGDRTDIHNIVTIPKRGNTPPLSSSQLQAESDGLGVSAWSIFDDTNAWRYESTKSIRTDPDIAALYQRDSAKLASLFKSGRKDIEISMVSKQIALSWTSPLELTDDHLYRLSVARWAGVAERSLPDIPAISARIRANRDEQSVIAGDAAWSTIVADLDPFRRIAIKQGLRPMVIGLGIVPVRGGPGALQFGDHLCTEAAAYGTSKQESEALLDLFGNAMWNLAHSPSTPLRSAARGYERLGIWSMVLPQPKRAFANGPTRRNVHTSEDVILASHQWFSITPGRQVKRMDDLVSDGLAQIMVERYQLHHAGILGVPFRTSLNADGTFQGGCLFALLAAPGLTKSQLDDVGHRASNLFLRQALNWPASGSLSEPPAAPPRDDTKKRSGYAQSRIELAMEHDNVWDALQVVCRQPADLRVKRLMKDFPEFVMLVKKHPNLLKLKTDLEANAGATPLVHSAWQLMGGGSIRSMYRWREEAGLPKRRDG